jgi:hypothetical protein
MNWRSLRNRGAGSFMSPAHDNPQPDTNRLKGRSHRSRKGPQHAHIGQRIFALSLEQSFSVSEISGIFS